MIFAIDFGTSNSLIAYYKNNKVEIIPNERGERLTPTAIFFKNDKEVYIGEIAKNQSIIEANNTILNIKRYLGTDFCFIKNKREYKATELASLVLRKLKYYAEKNSNEEVKKVVLSVPAYFNEIQRQDLLHAAYLADIEVVRLINEPTAASLSYRIEGKKNILVIDFGGGTLDISFIEADNFNYKVIAISGNNKIGGIDYDRTIAEYIGKKYQKDFDYDLLNDDIAYQQLLIHSEKLKKDLSSVEDIMLNIPYIAVTDKGPIHIKENFTRNDFYNITKSITDEVISTIENSFRENNIKKEWVDCVIFAGGGNRIYPIKEKIEEIFATTYKDIKFYSNINMDEVVVYGAAIYAGILEKNIQDIKFLDVTSHSFGLIDNNGNYIELIHKNASLPISIDKIFTTVEDNQKEVIIGICQKDDNGNIFHYGNLIMNNITTGKKGEVKLNVTFTIDENCILHVEVVELNNYNYSKVKVNSPFVTRLQKNQERRGKGLKIL